MTYDFHTRVKRFTLQCYPERRTVKMWIFMFVNFITRRQSEEWFATPLIIILEGEVTKLRLQISCFTKSP
jgi:hypothetical protein